MSPGFVIDSQRGNKCSGGGNASLGVLLTLKVAVSFQQMLFGVGLF